jgi:hypothetical protein
LEVEDAFGSGYIVASGGNVDEHMVQEWVERVSLGWRTDPYALISSDLSGEGRMPDSALTVGEDETSEIDEEYLSGDGGR